MEPDVIEGDGVRLRPYRDNDLPDVVAGCADPLTQRFLGALPHPYTEVDARWWLAEGAPATWARGGAAYAVADPDSDRLVGGVGLDRMVAERGQAEIGYWVAASANTTSQRVALACGYRHEGLRRAASPHRDGSRHDLVAWVRLADDPPGPAPRLLPDLPGGVLTDGVVALRPTGPDDVGLMYELHTLPEVVANRVPPQPPTRAEVARRCRTATSAWLVGTGANLVVIDAASGAAGGGLSLWYDDPRAGQAMLGASMLPRWRGHGLLTRGVRLLAGWSFGTAGIQRLWAGCRPENVAAQRVLEKAGFRREGIQRGRLPGPDGSRVDSVLYGLLPADLD